MIVRSCSADLGLRTFAGSHEAGLVRTLAGPNRLIRFGALELHYGNGVDERQNIGPAQPALSIKVAEHTVRGLGLAIPKGTPIAEIGSCTPARDPDHEADSPRFVSGL